MSDPVWDAGTLSWINSGVPSNTVTAAEAPTNGDATETPSNYLICERTGFRVSVSEGLKEEWDGRKVRKKSLEPRNAQDFVRARPESREEEG